MDSGDQGGGEVDPHQVHRFLAFLSFSEQYDSTMEEIGGGGGLTLCGHFKGSGGAGALPIPRAQVAGFGGDGVGANSSMIGRLGFMGLRRKGIALILWTPVAGIKIGR